MLPRILVALALIAAPALAQAQSQGTPSFKSLNLTGPGSTGDVSGMSVPAPSASSPLNSLGNLAYQLLRGTTVLVAPYLTDLTCAVDQTANVRTAAASAPAGAVLSFPPGCIAISGTLTNTKQRWVGAGPGNSGTTIAYSPATGTAIKLMGDAATLAGFHLYDSAAGGSTSATGIVQSDASENPTRQALIDVYVHDFTTNIDVESGYFWSWNRVWSRNFKQYGAYVANKNYCDNGDNSIVDYIAQYDYASSGSNSTTAGLRYETGGGIKLTNAKFLGAAFGFDLVASDTCNPIPGSGLGTGDLNFSNSSVENQFSTGIRFQGGTTQSFGSATIMGTEFAGSPTAIQLAGNLFNVAVSGNVLHQNNYGVLISSGVKGAIVSGNNFNKINTAAVALNEGSADVNVGPNNYSNMPGAWRVLDQRTTSAGPATNNETRPLALSSGQAAAGVFTVDLKPYRTVTATLVLEGLVQNVGAVSREVTLRLQHNGTTGIVTALSDTSTGTPPAMAFDAATTAGLVTVTVAGVAGNAFTGSLSVRIEGKMNGLKVLQ